MKTIILAGGLGSRLSEETQLKPKPLVPIGPEPILWHIMNIFASQGLREFVVALGYRGELIKSYFERFYTLRNDLTINLASGETTIHDHGQHPDWLVHLVDTGRATMTGGRLKRLEPWVEGATFMMTYGDGVADIDLDALLRFHRNHGKLATVTAVRPPARFGSIVFEGDRVARFAEKTHASEGWINGGFFVLEPGVFSYVEGDQTLWEHQPLEALATAGELMAYRHEGFWQPMDTLREKQFLSELWESGKAPWKRW